MKKQIILAAAVLQAAAAGCGTESGGVSQAEDVQEYWGGLVQGTGALKWPNGGIKAHIVRNKLDSSGPLTDEQIQWFQDNVRQKFGETWGRAADLFLDFFATVDNLGDVPSGELGIAVDPPRGATGGVLDFYGYDPSRPSYLVYGETQPSSFLLIHELGHVLGFADNEGGTASCTTQGSGTPLTPPDARYSVMMNHAGCWADPDNPVRVLSRWDEIGVRRLYGRKPAGLMVGVNNKCLDLTDNNPVAGQPLQTFSCHKGDAQTWKYHRSTERLAANMSGATTMEIRSPVTGPGLIVQAANPTGAASQHWKFRNAAIKGFGGKCFDVLNGVFQVGQPVNLVDCNGSAAQKFDVERVSTAGFNFRASGRNLCVIPKDNSVSRPLQLGLCPTSRTRAFYPQNNGGLRFGSTTGSCVAADGSDPNVTALPMRLTSCITGIGSTIEQQKQQFLLSGNIASGTNLCLTGQDPDFKDRTTTVAMPCSTSRPLVWDYYWLSD